MKLFLKINRLGLNLYRIILVLFKFGHHLLWNSLLGNIPSVPLSLLGHKMSWVGKKLHQCDAYSFSVRIFCQGIMDSSFVRNYQLFNKNLHAGIQFLQYFLVFCWFTLNALHLGHLLGLDMPVNNIWSKECMQKTW